MQRVSFGHEAHVQTAFGRVGTRHTPKFLSTSPMKQKRKLQQKPTKSRAWLEAECLKLARRTLGGSEIQRVTIAASERHGPQLEDRRYRSRRHWSAEKCAPRRRCSEGIARIPLSVSRRIGNRTRVRLWRSNARHSDLKSALRLERANRVRKKQSSAIIAA